MGWAFVAALFFGLYGSLVHPLLGLVGFSTPFLIKFARDKERAAHTAAQLEWQTRQEESERQRTAAHLDALENALRVRLNEKMSDALRTFRTTVKASPMGLKDYRRFDREIIRFLEAGLTAGDTSALSENGVSLRELYEQEIRDDLHTTLETHLTRQTAQPSHFVAGTPLDFERHCADLFRRCGYRVAETPASGDHGVDLIVERNGQSIAVQCKLYSQPVGNGAVQEVTAGRVHYGANSAVVIAINGFTSGAEVLARSNQVALIHPDDVGNLFGDSSPHAELQRSGRRFDWPPMRMG